MKGDFQGIKVCIIANYSPSLGGISGQVNLLYNNLKKEGADVRIVSTRSHILFKPLVFMKVLWNARGYDILHVHGCSWFGFLPVLMGVTVGRLLNKRVIVTYHGGALEEFYHKWGFLVRPFLNCANKISVPSTYLQDAFKRFDFNVSVLPNVLDIKYFEFFERRKIKPNLLIVKHLKRVYNIEMGIKALSIVRKHFPEAKLKIAGCGPLESELKSLACELKIAKFVVFLGKIDHRRITEVYSESDILLNCSKVESFGMVLLEAMASGLPVVSTNVGGVSSVIRDGVNGFLVESDNYIEMAEKLLYLLRNPEKAFEISKRGKEAAREYTWDAIKSRLKSLYIGS